MKNIFFSNRILSTDTASLILRIIFGGLLLFNHGVGKLAMLQQDDVQFVNFLGLGVHASAWLTAFAEFLCAAFVLVGLFTRVAIIPIVINMLTAILMAHVGQPFAKSEMALLYAGAFITIFLLGPGKYSADAQMFKKMPESNFKRHAIA
ncbi:MAG: DoxX family protein [Bacteroidota bacterium]